jgi:CRP-like cAMP-binding protein
MTSAPTERIRTNRILSYVPERERALFVPYLEEVEFAMNAIMLHPDIKPRAVFFPLTSIASVVAHPGESMIEAATVGREGFVGLPVFLGGISSTTVIVQIGGSALRMRAEDFQAAMAEAPEMSALLHRYSVAIMDEASQTAACNRTHPLEERCAKWILMVHDRVDGDTFPLTHKYLAVMLGVRRAGVTVAAGTLAKAGMITYTRGRVTVVDRTALEEASCDCYEKLLRVRERVFPAQHSQSA